MVKVKFACNKNWNSLTPYNESSRHCKDCDKLVQNFSKGHVTESLTTCGLLKLNQVSNIRKTLSLPKTGIFAVSLLTILGVTGVNDSVQAQSIKSKTETEFKQSGVIKIDGSVREKGNYLPIPFAEVQAIANDTQIGHSETDFDGHFVLTLDTSKIPLSDIEIVFSSKGFKTDTLNSAIIPSKLFDEEISIDLEAIIDNNGWEYLILGEISIEPEPIESEEKN